MGREQQVRWPPVDVARVGAVLDLSGGRRKPLDVRGEGVGDDLRQLDRARLDVDFSSPSRPAGPRSASAGDERAPYREGRGARRADIHVGLLRLTCVLICHRPFWSIF